MKKKTILLMGGGAVVVAVLALFFIGSGEQDFQINTAKVGKETIQSTVTATGYVQPVDKVDVGTQVSGVIEKIYVDFNSHVKKGQLLAELDKSTLTEKLSQALASVTSSQSALTYSQQNFDRVKQMYDAKAATQVAYEDATNGLVQSKTNVINAKANLHQAQVNLSYAEIYSPIDGVVLNRAVEQGQTVASSFNTPTLFTIANDLTKMQVEANVDEADIGNVALGQKVDFTVDAHTEDVFAGTVSQIRLQPTVTSNVVTYTVIIEAPNPEQKLFPGMTASVSIVTRSEEGLTVSTEALNFQPTEAIMEKYHVQLPVHKAPQEANAHATKGGLRTQNSDKGVWVQTPESMEHRQLQTGFSDGINTIVTGGLKEGESVILSVSAAEKSKVNGEVAVNPLMPQRPKGR